MARPVTRTVGSQAASTPIALNNLSGAPFNVNLLADVSAGGNLTYSVEYTLDDVQSATYVASSGVWTAVSGMGAQTADATGSLAYPVTAVRLNVTSYTGGSVTLTVVQQQ